MDEPLDELYLRWLHGQIVVPRLKNPARTYWGLARQMYKTQYIWWIPNDDNRAEDGKELRYEFLRDHGLIVPDREWFGMPCSVLEMVVGVSRRLAFEADGNPRDWAMHLLTNLDVQNYTDKNYNNDAERRIDSIVDRLIWRTYHPSGKGGLFPLRNPRQDQCDVEIWYQMAAYLDEL